MSVVKKPVYPKDCKEWWRKPVAQLTEEQKSIRRAYYRQYNAWRKSTKERPPDSEQWWDLPDDELTEEQLEMKRSYEYVQQKRKYQREYRREYTKTEKFREYQRNYQRTRLASDPEYAEQTRRRQREYQAKNRADLKKYREQDVNIV